MQVLQSFARSLHIQVAHAESVVRSGLRLLLLQLRGRRELPLVVAQRRIELPQRKVCRSQIGSCSHLTGRSGEGQGQNLSEVVIECLQTQNNY